MFIASGAAVAHCTYHPRARIIDALSWWRCAMSRRKVFYRCCVLDDWHATRESKLTHQQARKHADSLTEAIVSPHRELQPSTIWETG